MKPEDLKSPFVWSERHVVIHDRIWYIPALCDYETFAFPGWDSAEIFGNTHPVNIEYCSGNGAWIAAKAQENPDLNWVAVERKFERVRKIWSKIKNKNLSNLLVVCGEGHQFTSAFVKENSIDNIYINFPDPWPKRKHEKHRIIQKPFVAELQRILKPSGIFTFVTDDAPFSNWTIKIVCANSGFTPCYEKPFYITEYPGYGTSYFEELWREKGRLVRYQQYKKMV